jgi:DNA (cytosine-5)-methyltransferase 1
MEHTEILNTIHAEAEQKLEEGCGEPIPLGLSEPEKSLLDTIISCAEGSKGVLTVLVTSLVHKLFDPNQDVRKHQHNMPAGYSGRTIDTRYITPFMKEKQFPAMAESGWLTRSLEQNRPYIFDYPGKITPARLKTAFLQILDNIETHHKDPRMYLCYLFQHLIILREKKAIALAKPSGITIDTLLAFLDHHFDYPYSISGAARLPVLAVYSVYECMVVEMQRFCDKTLLPLKKHTTSDRSTGSIADIEIKDTKDNLFEAAEIKHGIKIMKQIIDDSFEKFKAHPVKRYYILSTAGIKEDEADTMRNRIYEIGKLHGCQVIINGVMPSLKYYLRLLKDPNKFVERYVENLREDEAIKFQHKETWNKIVSGKN